MQFAGAGAVHASTRLELVIPAAAKSFGAVGIISQGTDDDVDEILEDDLIELLICELVVATEDFDVVAVDEDVSVDEDVFELIVLELIALDVVVLDLTALEVVAVDEEDVDTLVVPYTWNSHNE